MGDTNKKQSIIDKINEMKQKKIQNENDKKMKKVMDIISRSNDKSKLKIKWSNKDFNNNLVIWIMSESMKSFNLYDSNENILLFDTNYKKVVENIDNLFVDFWDKCDSELEEIHISMEIYEDCGNEEVVIYKRKVICENHNIVKFSLISGVLEMDSDTEEEEDTELKKVGNVKQLIINQYVKSLVNLEKLKLKNSELEPNCVCECCMESMKEITIKYSGYENIDRYMECSNECLGDIMVKEDSD